MRALCVAVLLIWGAGAEDTKNNTTDETPSNSTYHSEESEAWISQEDMLNDLMKKQGFLSSAVTNMQRAVQDQQGAMFGVLGQIYAGRGANHLMNINNFNPPNQRGAGGYAIRPDFKQNYRSQEWTSQQTPDTEEIKKTSGVNDATLPPPRPVPLPRIEERLCGRLATPILSVKSLIGASIDELKCIFSAGDAPITPPLGFLYGRLLKVTNTMGLSELPLQGDLWSNRISFKMKCDRGRVFYISGNMKGTEIKLFSNSYPSAAPLRHAYSLAQDEFVDRGVSLWFQYSQSLYHDCRNELAAPDPVPPSGDSRLRRSEENSDQIKVVEKVENPDLQSLLKGTSFSQDKRHAWREEDPADGLYRQTVPTPAPLNTPLSHHLTASLLNRPRLLPNAGLAGPVGGLGAGVVTQGGGAGAQNGENTGLVSGLWRNFAASALSPLLRENEMPNEEYPKEGSGAALSHSAELLETLVGRGSGAPPQPDFLYNPPPWDLLLEETRVVGTDLRTGGTIFVGRALLPLNKVYRTMAWWSMLSLDPSLKYIDRDQMMSVNSRPPTHWMPTAGADLTSSDDSDD